MSKFTVEISKEKFLVDAKTAYNYYHSNTTINDDLLLRMNNTRLKVGEDIGKYDKQHFGIIENNRNHLNIKKLLNIIGMVTISDSDIVQVTEDVYELVYKYLKQPC